MLPLSIMGGKGTRDLSLLLLTTSCDSKIISNLKKINLKKAPPKVHLPTGVLLPLNLSRQEAS